MPEVLVEPVVPVAGVVEVPVAPVAPVPPDVFETCCLNGSLRKNAGSHMFPVPARLSPVPDTEYPSSVCVSGFDVLLVLVPVEPEGLVSAFEEVAGGVSSPPHEIARDTESITSSMAATAANNGDPLKFSNFLTSSFIDILLPCY